MLIIGCGDAQRGDDAAGIMAAQRLRLLGVPARICSGEISELIEMWRGADDVTVIDAVITGAPVGTVHVWDRQHRMKGSKSSGSTHGLGVAEAIELSRALGRLPQSLRVFGVEGQNFALGSKASPAVAKAVDAVVQRIASELNGES
jgi:hydrogenase maturation protease